MTLGNTPNGAIILAKAAGPDYDIVITTSPDGPQTDPYSGTVYLDATDPLGIGADNDDVPPYSEMQGLTAITDLGAAVVMAHELGHSIGAIDENEGGNNVSNNENPVRRDLGLPIRLSYHNYPLLPP